jgi:hypothetical protein
MSDILSLSEKGSTRLWRVTFGVSPNTSVSPISNLKISFALCFSVIFNFSFLILHSFTPSAIALLPRTGPWLKIPFKGVQSISKRFKAFQRFRLKNILWTKPKTASLNGPHAPERISNELFLRARPMLNFHLQQKTARPK